MSVAVPGAVPTEEHTAQKQKHINPRIGSLLPQANGVVPETRSLQNRTAKTIGQGTIVADKYRVESRIGNGSFGEIDIHTSKEVALKFESCGLSRPQLIYEAKIYEEMKEGFPKLFYVGAQLNYNIIAMELLGNTLDSLFEKQNKKFSLKTVLLIVDQMLQRIKILHEHSFIHRDIKPENWMFGQGEQSDTLYLIDFGLSKQYRNPLTQEHIPYREDCNLTGTARYCSINAHSGEQSRRDDLESIGYLLIYFLKGSLPWQGISRGVQTGHMQIIEQTKKNTSLDDLCKDLPIEFRKYMQYCHDLEFKTIPDYRYLRLLFRKLAVRKGYRYDNIFDWTSDDEVRRKQRLYANREEDEDAEKDPDNDFSNIEEEEYYHEKSALCLWKNNEKDSHEEYYALAEGIVGGDIIKSDIYIENLESSHCQLTWNQVKGAFCIKDCNTKCGSFLLLSAERRCREIFELQKGDKLYINDCVEIEIMNVEHTAIPIASNSFYMPDSSSNNNNNINNSSNNKIVEGRECEEANKNNENKTSDNSDKAKKKRKRIQFNVKVEDNEGTNLRLNDDIEINEPKKYMIKARIAVRIGKHYKNEDTNSLCSNSEMTCQIIDVLHDITLGSLSTNTVILPENCSGVHCKFSIKDEKLTVKDLAVGDPNGTKLLLNRPIELYERDILLLGDMEFGVMSVADCPQLEAVWEKCAIRMTPLRRSKRTPIYNKEQSIKKSTVYQIPQDGEVLIGRSSECTISIDDYKLAERHACMYYEKLDKKYLLESLVMSRAQVTQLLLGRASSATKAPYKLKQGDVFCIGGSQIEIIDMKVETPEQIETREQLSFERVEMLWKKVSLLSLLPKEVFTKVADALRPVSFHEGEIIVQQGEQATILYIIKKGKVDVKYNTRGELIKLKTLGPHDSLGDIAIVSGMVHTATAIAATETVECMALDSVSFLNFVGPYLGAMGDEAKKRDQESIMNVLSKFQFFNKLPVETNYQLSNVLSSKTFKDGEYITKEGDRDSNLEFFIILNGEVKITKNQNPDHPIAMLSYGDYLGELAMLTGQSRTANAVAVGLVETLVCNEENFKKYLKDPFEKLLGINASAVIPSNNNNNNNNNNGNTPNGENRGSITITNNGTTKEEMELTMTQRYRTRKLSNKTLQPTPVKTIRASVKEGNSASNRTIGLYGGVEDEIQSASEEEFFLSNDDEEYLFDASNTLTKAHYIILKVQSGPMRGELFAIESDLITIGRGICTITVNDMSLSNVHCCIEYRDGGYWLYDSDSESGTFLQLGVGLAFPVQVGDVFRLGHTELTVLGKTKIVQKSNNSGKDDEDGDKKSKCCLLM